MPSFTYTASDATGVEQNGSLIAETEEAARNALIKRGWTVESLKQQSDLQWTVEDRHEEDDISTASEPENIVRSYVPLTDTMRLFFGWLLAWYGLVYILGTLQYAGKISEDIPFIQAMFTSPIIIRLTFGTFLFLMLTSLHRVLGKGLLLGTILTICWFVLMTLFHLNI